MLSRVIAVAGVLGVAPVLLPVVLMNTKDGGPAFFKHRRVGKNGKNFNVYKIRTMVVDADDVLQDYLSGNREAAEQWSREQKLQNDPRVTGFGRFLRKTSIDELPQLINVIRGSMAIVGPRPVTADELLRYGRSGRHYLGLKPGITGLWQVSGRSETTYNRRVALDRYYAVHKSLRLDFYIIVKTVAVVFTQKGAF